MAVHYNVVLSTQNECGKDVSYGRIMQLRRYHQVPSVGVPELLLAGAAIIDVRRPEEWQLTGVVNGAICLTFFAADGSSDPLKWLAAMNQRVPAAQDLVLICRSGRRTAIICDFLLEVTVGRQLYNVSDGMLGWLAAGLPVSLSTSR